MPLKDSIHRYNEKRIASLQGWQKALAAIYHTLLTNRRWFLVLSASVSDFFEQKMYYFTGHFTYSAFLGLLASMVAAQAVIGFFIKVSDSAKDQVLKGLESIVPIIGSAPNVSAKALVTYMSVIGVIGIVALIWTGAKVFGSLESGFCEIWGSERRRFAKGRALGVALIALMGVMLLLAVVILLGFSAFWGWLVGKDGALFSVGNVIGRIVLGLLANFFVFLFLFKVVPTVKQSTRKCAFVALLCGGVFLALQYALSFYFEKISKVPSIYGSVSTVVVVLIWLHLTGIIVFMGAELVHVMSDEALVERYKADPRVPGFLKPAAALDQHADGAVKDA